MKKKKLYFIFLNLCMMCFNTNVYAASISANITSSSVTKGNSVTITVTFSSPNSIYFTEGKLSCTGAGVNKSIQLNDDGMADGVHSKPFRMSISPTEAGTVKCTIQNARLTDSSSNDWHELPYNRPINITVKNRPKPSNNGGGGYRKPQSSNNNLSSLTVDGLELNEKFDKEVLEYSVKVPAGTEKIKINAQLADSNAKVTGIGELEVSEGLNTFEIIVTAENGSKRKYILKAMVEELKPIKVKVNNEDFVVVRKRKNLPKISEYFTEKDLEIDKEKVEGYYSEKLNYTLVGLKNSKGDIDYYIYKGYKYQKYNEYVFNGTTLYILDKEVPQTKKTTFKYDDDVITSYQEVKLDYIKNTYALDNNDIQGNQFYLFYAQNIETGKEELYQYDAKEKTIQRYNTLILNQYKKRSDKYYVLLLGSLLLLGITIVIFSIILIRKNKKDSNGNQKITKSKDIEKALEANLNSDIEDEIPIKENINETKDNVVKRVKSKPKKKGKKNK